MKEKYIERVYGILTVWHHTVFCWLIDSIWLSSNQQIIQLKGICVLRTMNRVAVYIHFLKGCWSDWDHWLTKILDQLMLLISPSSGWMDWQKYPKNRKWIRIQQSNALGCKTCLAFAGMRVQHLVCMAQVCITSSSLIFFCQRFLITFNSRTGCYWPTVILLYFAMALNRVLWLVHDPNSETCGPCARS